MLIQQSKIEEILNLDKDLLKKLHSLKIFTINDLLFFFPKKYENKSNLTDIADINLNYKNTICGEIIRVEESHSRRRILTCVISDRTGFANIKFFNYSQDQIKQFKNNQYMLCYGKANINYRSLDIIHPEYTLSNDLEVLNNITQTKYYNSIYKLNNKITPYVFNELIKHALNFLAKNPYQDDEINTAIYYLHNMPKTIDFFELENKKSIYHNKIALDEITAHQLQAQSNYQKNRNLTAINFKFKSNLATTIKNNLPFELTNAQNEVLNEIYQDLAKNYPMQRLVQGDVGCGKTLVACLSAIQVLNENYQVAFLAPTEVLVEQHKNNFDQWLKPFNLKIATLTGKYEKKSIKEKKLQAIKNGEINLIIGTHAIFQEKVKFNNLALIIIDEQHKFGVNQRISLLEKADLKENIPHQLYLTATPIPRSLAMTMYADLSLSIINQLPANRIPIKTSVIANNRRDEIIERIQQACQQKKQVYWVCTLIDISEKIEAQTLNETLDDLQTKLPTCKIAQLHGKMKSAEKQQIINDFKNHKTDILIATTVIEVGVDIPNANIMIIENPERLGLSQLHQLRGRVGRGNQQSFCILLYQAPISEIQAIRLKIMKDSNDGFEIAEKDLEIRGHGEILGTKQTGNKEFKHFDLIKHNNLIALANHNIEKILQDPKLVSEIKNRWFKQSTEKILS